MTHALNRLIELLVLEPLDEHLFRGASQNIGTGRIYGGQVLGQALTAMQHTVDQDRTVHSLHAYFMREGNHDIPIVYRVENSRDGRSFSVRHVTALQHDIPIFLASASFQIVESGLGYQTAAPDIPGPDNFKDLSDDDADNQTVHPDGLHSLRTLSAPFAVRPVTTVAGNDNTIQYTWIKASHTVTDTADCLHQAILAYLSDYGLITTILRPHKLQLHTPGLQLASIDHGIWYHRSFRIDEWLLYACRPLNTSGGRGLAQGCLYREDGTLIATTIQEGLLRQKKGQ